MSLWSVHEDSVFGEFSDYAKQRILSIWPDATFENGHVYVSNHKHMEPPLWIFKKKYDLVATDHPNVLYEKNIKKYIGYSHRGSCSFGIGDMLFTEDLKDYSEYYRNPKYRWKYILTLLEYHIRGDYLAFEDLCEDNIIGHGISQIIPFREKGTKRIETLDEAYQAALNFLNYML